MYSIDLWVRGTYLKGSIERNAYVRYVLKIPIPLKSWVGGRSCSGGGRKEIPKSAPGRLPTPLLPCSGGGNPDDAVVPRVTLKIPPNNAVRDFQPDFIIKITDDLTFGQISGSGIEDLIVPREDGL